ncbi:hypothetical protein B484DRAFT_397575 [Ochromonadaceae sp. CCMP2298]|nr:hypothetical protein B484DRAFT_397575 [Ochromonadaceae sp. CCMP2298]
MYRNAVRRNRVNGVARFTKDSNISEKRAEAANPILHSVMQEKFLAKYAAMYKSNLLKTEVPLAHQIWNGDEVGWDPNGKYRGTFGFNADGVPPAGRAFRVHKGEKAPFWATLFMWSCASGEHTVPPIVVHKGGSAKHTRADFYLGALPDWVIHNTESGYMDAEGFMIYYDFVCYHALT